MGGNPDVRRLPIFRDDQSPNPVHVLDGAQRSLLDPVGVTGPDYARYTSYPDAGSSAQRHTEFDNVAAPTVVPAIEVGVPHAYGIQILYSMIGLDLPGAPGGLFYFLTGIEPTGRATPLNRPLVVTPNGATASDGSTFAFQSALPSGGTTSIQYVVEASTSLDFTGIVHIGTVTSAAAGEIRRRLVGLNAAFPAGTTVYVRVGARNARDLPGPVANGATRDEVCVQRQFDARYGAVSRRSPGIHAKCRTLSETSGTSLVSAVAAIQASAWPRLCPPCLERAMR